MRLEAKESLLPLKEENIFRLTIYQNQEIPDLGSHTNSRAVNRLLLEPE